MQKLEVRLLSTKTTTTSDNSLSGIAVPYNELSHPIPGAGRSFREKIRPGALTYDENTVMLTQHDQRGRVLRPGAHERQHAFRTRSAWTRRHACKLRCPPSPGNRESRRALCAG